MFPVVSQLWIIRPPPLSEVAISTQKMRNVLKNRSYRNMSRLGAKKTVLQKFENGAPKIQPFSKVVKYDYAR